MSLPNRWKKLKKMLKMVWPPILRGTSTRSFCLLDPKPSAAYFISLDKNKNREKRDIKGSEIPRAEIVWIRDFIACLC